MRNHIAKLRKSGIMQSEHELTNEFDSLWKELMSQIPPDSIAPPIHVELEVEKKTG